MAAHAKRSLAPFDPTAYESFRFLGRELGEDGRVTLRYALDEEVDFVEHIELPIAVRGRGAVPQEQLERLLALLHWVAGVSYYKTALPAAVICESGAPPPATAALLEALYSEGLGELAYTNGRDGLPAPRFPVALAAAPAGEHPARDPERVLVPVGGGKDSIVALETVRRSGCELALFSVGDPPPIARTVAVAGLPRLLARRTLDQGLAELNARGAINGHVPITAIVSCIALLAAALNGFDAVAMANERSASSPNVSWRGSAINHQFSKSWRAEQLLRAALAEASAGVGLFSLLRPASELAIARAFAAMGGYHGAFTSCNALFRLDPAQRASAWCCECPKCRFVFLALAPFSEPAHLGAVFGRELLDEEEQFEGFALLTATGGHKPFECVGEEQESIAAIRLLAEHPGWREQRVVRRLLAEVLPLHPPPAGDPAAVLALGEEHAVPQRLLAEVRAVLGA
jgi:hypothetical protein